MQKKINTKPLAIISGGTGYLGGAIMESLLRAGWRVVSLSRAASKDSTIESYKCDITDEVSVEKTIGIITDKYGPIQACIHAASPKLSRTKLAETPLESFDAHIAVSVRGAFLLARASLPHMKEGSTYIGITSSVIEQDKLLPPLGSYISAKYALRGFLRVLSSEVTPQNIRVYAIAPGFLKGGLNRDVPGKIIDFLSSKSDSGFASIEDIADIVKNICVNPGAIPSGSSISYPPRVVSPL